jgi:hypothetical protein
MMRDGESHFDGAMDAARSDGACFVVTSGEWEPRNIILACLLILTAWSRQRRLRTIRLLS